MNSTHVEGVAVTQIRSELDRVLASEEFENSERMKSFLTYLVTESIEGRSDRLKGYNIGVDVFERGEEFDPQVNPIVRVEAGRLRRLLHNYYLRSGENARLKIVVPKGTYVPLFEEPDTSGVDSNVRQVSSESADPIEDLQVLTMPRGPSIVVLPFDNMSVDPEQAIFSDGLAEEITTQLARFSTLFVVARNTAFQFRNKNVDVRQIGHDLEVHYVLEGSVRAAGSRIRVTAQLIDATSGMHMWAENYDRDITTSNLIELQDDVARSVVGAIAEPHGVISRYDFSRSRNRGVEDMDLYTFVLRWFDYTRKYDPDSHSDLRLHTARMLENHADHTLVWTVRGLLALDEDAFGYDEKEGAKPALERALEHLTKAVHLDPTNEKAFQYLLTVRYLLGDIDGAFEAGKQALQLNPNDSDVAGEYGSLRCYAGDWDGGLKFLHKSIALNPLHSPMLFVPLCLERYRVGDDQAALRYAEKCDMPGFFWSYAIKAITNGQLNRSEPAQAAVSELLEQAPHFATDGATEFRKWVKDEALVQRFQEGLAKAGLVLP